MPLDRGGDRHLHLARRPLTPLRKGGQHKRLRHVLGSQLAAAFAHLGAEFLQTGAGRAQATVGSVVFEICHWVRILVTESKKGPVSSEFTRETGPLTNPYTSGARVQPSHHVPTMPTM